MDKETEAEKPHALVIPYPAQGHINPALAFAKSLASNGLLITVITTTNITKTAKLSHFDSITIKSISDGSEQVEEPESIEDYCNRFKSVFSHNLAKFIDNELTSSGCAINVVIYDSMIPWVLDIARERGLIGAPFFTQCCAVGAVFYHMKQGWLRLPYEDCSVSFPSLPALEKSDLPSLDEFLDSNQTVVKLLADQFSNIEDVDWIFFNTFDALETETVDWMASRWPIKTVGPTFLLQHAENKSSDKNHMISLFEPKHEACIEWLDSRQTGSVVYVSFGSIASLKKEQMEELAFGLIISNCHFLWVARTSEVDKLPPDFTTLASEKGLIVEWCHQPEVLAHHALSCFVSHCGWNSTLEALSHGVPLIAMARWVDQNTNSKLIEDVWRAGVRVRAGENGIVGREEIAMCIKRVIDGDEGIEVKRNACKWKELANEAVGKGGTSANNVEDFVSKLMGR